MSSNRSIFEDVGSDKREENAPKGGLIDQGRSAWKPFARLWLFTLFALVALMIVVGGLTRLTDSGLSITEWNPISGAIPPLNPQDWQIEFDKYKEIPEFQLVNSQMTLAEFKVIFWWEWGHRQLGRVIGLVWAIGFAVLALRYRVRGLWLRRFLILGALGGLQGAIGWWMVSSGLTGRMVDVASYRLATHLGLAFLIMGLISWYVLLAGREDKDLFQAQRHKDERMAKLSRVLLGLIFFQIVLGALVAGIDAGRNYPTWPLMNGEFFPSESFSETPFWSNFFENAGLVQFNHRILAYLIAAKVALLWWRSRDGAINAVRSGMSLVAIVTLFQVVIGIYTALTAAHLHIAITHQIGAIFLFVATIRLMFFANYPPQQSIKG